MAQRVVSIQSNVAGDCDHRFNRLCLISFVPYIYQEDKSGSSGMDNLGSKPRTAQHSEPNPKHLLIGDRSPRRPPFEAIARAAAEFRIVVALSQNMQAVSESPWEN